MAEKKLEPQKNITISKIVVEGQDLQNLYNYFDELPTKFGGPLKEYFNQLAMKQVPKDKGAASKQAPVKKLGDKK